MYKKDVKALTPWTLNVLANTNFLYQHKAIPNGMAFFISHAPKPLINTIFAGLIFSYGITHATIGRDSSVYQV